MIDRDLAVRLVVAAAERVSDHQDELSRLDSVAGDGDHGVNMATALAEAARRAQHGGHGTAAEVMRTTGSAFHETVGGERRVRSSEPSSALWRAGFPGRLHPTPPVW